MHIIPELGPVLILTVPFLVAFGGFWLILWNPLMQYLDERESAVVGARTEAKSLTDQADERATTLEEKLADAHRHIVELKAEHRAKAVAHEAEVLTEARGKADARIQEAVAGIREQQRSASKELETNAKGLATDIVSTLIGREVA